MNPNIYKITPEHFNIPYYFERIIALDMTTNYYWSDEWDESFYRELAYRGFISTSYELNAKLFLLPELQFSYSVLSFEDLHISKKVQKLLSKDTCSLCFNTRFSEVIEQISLQHKDNWLQGHYKQLTETLHQNTYTNFKLISVELILKEDNRLIAGEIGYIIGSSYTSLSGFSSRDKRFTNYGTLQLVLLAQHLKSKSFSFWNLGHPFMEYKRKLGSKIYQRDLFLEKWNKAVKKNLYSL